MSKKVHTIVHDWDGTLVELVWPGHGEWMPGAVEAVRRFHAAGHHQVVFSARLSPIDPVTGGERDPSFVQSEILTVRAKLDDAGLTYVDIWTRPGKPGGSVYIDDKGERYNGGAKSWARLTDKILLRLDGEEPLFPITPPEVPA